MLSELRKTFLTGLLILSPMTLTIYIFYILFGILDGILKNAVSSFLSKLFGISHTITSFPGLGLIVLIALIMLTGMIARNYFGRKILAIGEFVVTHIPLINRIYIGIREISEAILSEKREVFKKAVLIEYPRKGLYTMGFFTQDTRGPIQDILDKDVVSVFVPTTPNPTSGFLLFVPKSQITDLNMSVESAMKLVISGGSVHLKDSKGISRKTKKSLIKQTPF